jgi:hypothetical protein
LSRVIRSWGRADGETLARQGNVDGWYIFLINISAHIDPKAVNKSF